MHYKGYGKIFDWITRVSALIIFALGFLAFIGWFTGRTILSSFRADYIPMAPNTALSFIFLSIALCLSLGSTQWRKRAAVIISSVVGIIALLRMSEFLTGVDLQVDRWIFSYTGETLGLIPVGQMALPTAISLLLISSSLILLATVSDKGPKELSSGRNMLAGMLVFAPFVMGSAFLLGYIYGAPISYGSTKIPMAFSTSIAMIASSIGVLSIMLDSNIKMGLEYKRAVEERNRLFNLSIDMLAIAGFDGYFKQLNPAWEKTLGWTKDELLSKPYIHFVHPDDIKSTIDAAKQLTAGKEVITFENRYRCSSGSYKWFSWSLSSLMEEKFIFAIGRDITDEKQLEGAKTLFLSMVSHELRTPLTPMQSQLELLINKKMPKRMQKESLNIVLRNVVRLNRLINDLLDITRLEAGRLKIRKSRESL
ncbi:MAG TPA: histidine kinase dimerization/phospho-acceptor domain-containing protein, partial [Candidatus Nanoarchaeia archaeon]|nr:histidine kinase dimerization/phospho-acceptor domain-containing protein [Candidatus Nanoarchaeia archaeon]